MDWNERIVTHTNMCGGRPRIKGTRISVEFLFGLKATGWTDEQILENYPHLTRDDLQAIFAYAQSILEDESFLPLDRAG